MSWKVIIMLRLGFRGSDVVQAVSFTRLHHRQKTPTSLLTCQNGQSIHASTSRPLLATTTLYGGRQQMELGVAPERARISNTSCLLVGYPFVLVSQQRQDPFYQVIGPSFMDGFMDGEIVGMLAQGAVQAKRFALR